LFWQFIAYAIAQLLKQFYCARKLRHKLPQFIAVCVISLRLFAPIHISSKIETGVAHLYGSRLSCESPSFFSCNILVCTAIYDMWTSNILVLGFLGSRPSIAPSVLVVGCEQLSYS